jgi:hypothetical protein
LGESVRHGNPPAKDDFKSQVPNSTNAEKNKTRLTLAKHTRNCAGVLEKCDVRLTAVDDSRVIAPTFGVDDRRKDSKEEGTWKGQGGAAQGGALP